MSSNTLPPSGWRDWLMSDAPQSRRQATLGRWYAGWRTFARNRLAVSGLVIVMLLVLLAVFAPVLAPFPPFEGDLVKTRLLPPSTVHWLGTDALGRDVLARVLYGFRLSVSFGLIVTLLTSVIGILAGAIQGYFGGLTDLIFQRVIEIWSSTPTLYVIIIISAVWTMNFWLLTFLMVLFGWMGLVGLVRAEFLRARNFEYVRAAKALGVSDFAIILRHVLPNATVATMTMMPFILSGTIGSLTALDFLGFGLPASAPSLGELTQQAKQNLQAPWLAFTAFATFSIMLSLLVFISEGVRDAFDPRKTFS